MIGSTMTIAASIEGARAPVTTQRPTPSGRLRLLGESRLLGANERFFVAQHRFTATNVVRVIVLEDAPSVGALEAALTSLQARHPMLRARIDGRSLIQDEAPALSLRVLQRRDDRHVHELLERLLDTALPLASGPLLEAHYLRSDRTRRAELILVGDHAVTDGVGMNNLCAELLALSAGEPPRSPRRTLPMLEELLPRYSTLERLSGFAPSLLGFARVSLLRARRVPYAAPESSCHAAIELDEAQLAALLTRARAERTTITGALMASILLTLREARPRDAELALSVPVNLRERVPGNKLSAQDLGNYTSAAYLHSPARAAKWELARTLSASLERKVQSAALLSALPLVYDTGRKLVRRHGSPLAHAMISNSGVLPIARSYGGARVVGFYSASSAPMLSAAQAFFCNTLHGRLCINLVFAEQIISRDQATELLAQVRDTLTRR
jgi:hypothetical protein